MKTIRNTVLCAAAALACAMTGPAEAQTNLNAETGSPGGSSYTTLLHLAEIGKRSGAANLQITEGQTLTNSVRNVAEGKTDIAPAPFIIPFLLSKGLGPYASVGDEQGQELAGNLRLIFPYIFGVYTFFAYDTSPVDGWDSIAGNKILNGPPGGAAVNTSRGLVQIVTGLTDGKDYEGVQINWAQATEAIMQGTVEAAVSPELYPSPRIVQASSAGRVNIYSIPKNVYEAETTGRFLRAPGSAPYEAPIEALEFSDNVAFVSEDEMFRGLAAMGGAVVNKNMDEDLAYRLVKEYVSTLDELKAKVPYGGMIGLDQLDADKSGMCGANPLKYHPGAVRAWEEAGYTVPDCAK
ncbi:TAXI family TRAP transporter solute-binding subunit [Fluviibacterium sp. DFM31]|uniref:TAXI family TRAP transporter solute-binding subunit n=1 Tax=Meridianimarinicoccus marinus TaxID=3231483 RepID=A0ABV3LBM3_9RHOB